MDRFPIYETGSHRVEVLDRVLRQDDFHRTKLAIEQLERANHLVRERESETENALAQAREVGFDQGFSEGLKKAMEAFTLQHEQLMLQLQKVDSARHDLAIDLAVQLLHKISPSLSAAITIQGLLRATLTKIEPSRIIAVRVHSQHETNLKQWLESNGYQWEIVPDPTLDALDCVLETRQETFAVGYHHQVGQLEAKLAELRETSHYGANS